MNTKTSMNVYQEREKIAKNKFSVTAHLAPPEAQGELYAT
jgi:hypothetical protein